MATLKSKQLSILKRSKELLFRFVDQVSSEIVKVPINLCRHYCAFKYGCKSFNPYENYITGLHEGQSKKVLKNDFIDFLMFYRPRDFGEVLGIQMSNNIPLWSYPWLSAKNISPLNGWEQNIDLVPDIITHFCEQGIKRSRINEEFYWLEQAYHSILSNGYQPNRYSYIEAIEIKHGERKIYLITDGNHRISSLAAIGRKDALIKVVRLRSVDSKKLHDWIQVRFGTYTEQDALRLINVYINGVTGFIRSGQPAQIIDD